MKKENGFWTAWSQANALYSDWAEKNNINYYQLFVLYVLYTRGSASQKTICVETSLQKQTVNGVIRTLKKDGFVTLSTNESDKREKQVELTEQGLAYAEKFLISLYSIEEKVTNFIGEERIASMAENMMLYTTILKKIMEEEKNE